MEDMICDGQTNRWTDARGENNMSTDPYGWRHNHQFEHSILKYIHVQVRAALEIIYTINKTLTRSGF